PYSPALTGAGRNNRMLLEALAAQGHSCRAIAPSSANPNLEHFHQLAEQLGQGLPQAADGIQVRTLGRVELHEICESTQLRRYAQQQLRQFDPTWVLVSSEDPLQVLVEAAVDVHPDRVVVLALTTKLLPFG